MDNLVLLNLREFLREILLSPIASIKFLHAALNTSVINIQGARSRKKRTFPIYYYRRSWWRGTVVERRSLKVTGELSLSCARPAADG